MEENNEDFLDYGEEEYIESASHNEESADEPSSPSNPASSPEALTTKAVLQQTTNHEPSTSKGKGWGAFGLQSEAPKFPGPNRKRTKIEHAQQQQHDTNSRPPPPRVHPKIVDKDVLSTILLKNVPMKPGVISELAMHFEQFGQVLSIRIQPNEKRACIQFATPELAKKAAHHPAPILNNRFIEMNRFDDQVEGVADLVIKAASIVLPTTTTSNKNEEITGNEQVSQIPSLPLINPLAIAQQQRKKMTYVNPESQKAPSVSTALYDDLLPTKAPKAQQVSLTNARISVKRLEKDLATRKKKLEEKIKLRQEIMEKLNALSKKGSNVDPVEKEQTKAKVTTIVTEFKDAQSTVTEIESKLIAAKKLLEEEEQKMVQLNKTRQLINVEASTAASVASFISKNENSNQAGRSLNTASSATDSAQPTPSLSDEES